jgi:hypothetical protein
MNRSQKSEARSQQTNIPLSKVFFWLLTIVREPFWLLASGF